MGLGGFLGLGEVRDLYRKVGDIGGLHFHQVPSKSVPRGAKTSQKTVYLRIPSEQTTCCFLQARTVVTPLFATLATAAVWHIGEFSMQELANTA